MSLKKLRRPKLTVSYAWLILVGGHSLIHAADEKTGQTAVKTTIAPVGASTWKIPAPAQMEHPGSVAAPASDPRTYADEKGFGERSRVIIQGLAPEDLGKWRKGYFSGGDPGKYLPGAAMAKLLLNPEDAMARQYMNDDRSYKENYHFAAVNWARFLPLFSAALTPETRQKLAEQAGRFSAYLTGGGTENHKTMWMTSANVLPHYLEGGRLATKPKEAALAQAKEQLKSYVKGLYMAGQGEWDSSTYLMFDVNGMLNIYDFSPDAETRLLAKSALDWMATAYALKYRDGLYTAPNQRGFAPAPMKKITDQTGWLWWGSQRQLKPEDAADFRYALHAVTSGWRPNKVISNIATKQVTKLPFEQRNTKPNYWYGLRQPPIAGAYHEAVYNTQSYTMGSLWSGWGGQMARFQIVAVSPNGGISFTGGHPFEYKYEDGNGKYDQTAQVGNAFISMSKIPDNDPLPYAFFSLAPEASKPVQKGKWWFIQAGPTFIGAYPLSEQVKVGESDSDPTKRNQKPLPILRFEGRRTGFIVQTADKDTQQAQGDLTTAFNTFMTTVETRCKVDTSKWQDAMEVTYTMLDGTLMRMKYSEGQDRADVSINGQPVTFDNAAVYAGPYINQKNGVLSVNDGREGFIIDFSGDMPVYKAWQK